MKYLINTILFSVLLTSSVVTKARTIEVATVEWPPYFSENLKDQGPLAAITRAALKVRGHDVNILFMPWKRALKEVEYGRFDMVLGAFDTQVRRKQFFYTEQIFSVDEYIIGLESKGINSFHSLKDLRDYTFGTTLGYSYSKEFVEAEYLARQPVSSDLLNLRKLFIDRIDFVVMNSAAFRDTLNKIPREDRRDHVLLTPALSTNSVYNLVSRRVSDSAQLLADFKFGLKTIKANGTYDAIIADFDIK